MFTVISRFAKTNPSHVPTYNALHFSDTAHRSLVHLKEFNWIHHAHPFLPLVPQWNVFKGSLFSCLDHKNECFPYVRQAAGGRKYFLARDVTIAWDQLEKHLRKLVLAMLEEGKPDTSLMDPTISLWSYPASYGYQHGYESIAALQQAAQCSRDAFLPLIAAGTLSLLWLRRKERLHLDYTWRERLQTKNGIHPEWFGAFERSYANDKDVLRTGGIIDATHRTTPLLLSFYRQLNVPVCVHWGELKDLGTVTKGQYNETGTTILKDGAWTVYRHIFESLADVFPTNEEFWKLFARVYDNPHPNPEDSLSVVPVASSSHPRQQYAPYQSYFNVPDSDSPIVEKNSGQRPGQTWQEFFARRDGRNQERLALETPVQRRSRENREREASKYHAPGRKGAVCWYWDNRSGFRVRTCLTRGQVESEWERLSDAQKRYDGFSNTWDLCSEFGEFDPDSDDDWEEDAPQDTDVGVDPEQVEGGNEQEEDEDGEIADGPPIITDTETTSGEALKAIGGYPEAEDEVTADFVPIRMEEVAFERYGFSDCEWEREGVDLIDLDTTRNLLGNGRWRNNPNNAMFSEPDPPSETMDKLRQFFHILSLTHTSPLSLPSHDLSDPSSYISDALNWEILVIKVTVDNEVWHLVRKKSDLLAPKMVLLIKCPVSVLHIVRCAWGPDLHIVASQLIRHGIRFHILVRGDPPPQAAALWREAAHASTLCFLGFRRAGYTPDIHDWRAYETERDQFLRSARGRAAVLAGGLLSRMATTTVSEENVIFGGDPERLQRQGRCFWEHEGAGYWDDFLTPVEVDLLCGVYMVERGKCVAVKNLLLDFDSPTRSGKYERS